MAAQRVRRPEGARDDAGVEQAVGGVLGRLVIANRDQQEVGRAGRRLPAARREPGREPLAFRG